MNLLPSLCIPSARRLVCAFASRRRAVLTLYFLIFAIVNFLTMQYLTLSYSATTIFLENKRKSATVMPVGRDSISCSVPPSENVTLKFSTLEQSKIRRTPAARMQSPIRSPNQSLIPRRFHHMFRDDCLPAKYALSLRALVRLHAFRDAGSSNCSNTFISANTSIATPPSASAAPTTAESQRDELFDYHFWSDSALNDLKRDRLASADSLYGALALTRETIELTDMARYLVIYELGGVYADFDVEFMHPVNDLLQRGYPCIISAENPMQV